MIVLCDEEKSVDPWDRTILTSIKRRQPIQSAKIAKKTDSLNTYYMTNSYIGLPCMQVVASIVHAIN